MAIVFPKYSLELFLANKEAARHGNPVRSSLLESLDSNYWLDSGSRSTGEEGGATKFQLPPILASDDCRTWLATRKPMKEKSRIDSGDMDTWLSKDSTSANSTNTSAKNKPVMFNQPITANQWLLRGDNQSVINPINQPTIQPTNQTSKVEPAKNNLLFQWTNTNAEPKPMGSVALKSKPVETKTKPVETKAKPVGSKSEHVREALLQHWNNAGTPVETTQTFTVPKGVKTEASTKTNLLNLWSSNAKSGTDEAVKTSPGDKIEVMDVSNSEEVKSEVSSLTSQLLTSMTEKMEVLDEMLIADQDWIFARRQEVDPVLAVQQGLAAFHQAAANQSESQTASLSPVHAVREGFKSLLTTQTDIFKPARKQSVAESLTSTTTSSTNSSVNNNNNNSSGSDFHSIGIWLLDSQLETQHTDGSDNDCGSVVSSGCSIVTLEDPMASLDDEMMEEMVMVETKDIDSWLMQ